MKWMTKALMMSAFAVVALAGLLISLPERAESAALESGAAKISAIESIAAIGEGNSAELFIKLSRPSTYTSYKTTSPLRLVIDLSQTSTGAINAPLVVNKGNFKTVSVSKFETEAGVLTRIEVELVKDVEAILTASPANPGELKVSFPMLADQQAAAPLSSAPVQPLAEESSVAALEQPASPVAAEPEISSARLTSITARDNTILLALDGTIKEYKAFRLNQPERYVIDLLNAQSALATRLLALNSAGVASARVGLYPDKVRVVFDAVNSSFPEASAENTADGVLITLNQKKSADTMKLAATRSEETAEKPAKPAAVAAKTPVAAPAAPAAAEKPAKAPASTNLPTTIEMIDFQVVEDISRVSVTVKGAVSYEQPVKTPGFITLTIKNALLPKNLQRSLETHAFVSPVMRVTPLAVKTKKGNDTKIRVAMRNPASYEIRQEGDVLLLDIKHPTGLTAERLAIETTDAMPKAARPKAAKSRDDELSSEFASVAETPVKQSASGKVYRGRKVTLEFADAEVRKIFQLLSEVSNKNFVLGDDVTGAISLKLVNVPWDQALDIILDTKGLDKREDGNIILIKGKGKFKSQAEEEQEIRKALTRSIELRTETFNINYADIATIASQFNGLKSDRGIISQDVRTNKVIVKDIPQNLDDMRRLLAQLDVPEKQVMIEARIVEASSTFTRNLGVNWGVHFRDGSASFLGINSLDTGFGGLTSAPPTRGTGTTAGGTMGISFGTLSSNIQLDLRLNAAASAGMVKIVSTPKVATLNNKTAKITQGQQIPYTSSTSDKVETKFIEAALSLEVTPHINANGTISMKIDAKNDSPGQSTGTTAPPINKKQATTEMLLRDGETTVIGGIYVDSDNSSDDGVPYLMDIPLLGKLFKTNNKTKTKTELLIFITPRILGTI